MATARNLDEIIATLRPSVRDGRWVFATFDGTPPFDLKIAVSIRELSTTTVVAAESEAERLGLSHDGVWAWIECAVRASLHAVGVTGALATAVGRASIPCNVVAGVGSDHLFVPFAQLQDALAALDELTVAGRKPTRASAQGPPADGIEVVPIGDDEIRLGQFLKLASLVDSGAAVKPLLAYGRVRVNGEAESRRGRRLVAGDVVTLDGRSITVG